MKKIKIAAIDENGKQEVLAEGRGAICFILPSDDDKMISKEDRGIYGLAHGNIGQSDLISLAKGVARVSSLIADRTEQNDMAKQCILETFCDVLENELGILKDEEKKKILDMIFHSQKTIRVK